MKTEDHIKALERNLAAAGMSLDRVMSGRAGDPALGELRATLKAAQAQAQAWMMQHKTDA